MKNKVFSILLIFLVLQGNAQHIFSFIDIRDIEDYNSKNSKRIYESGIISCENPYIIEPCMRNVLNHTNCSYDERGRLFSVGSFDSINYNLSNRILSVNFSKNRKYHFRYTDGKLSSITSLTDTLKLIYTDRYIIKELSHIIEFGGSDSPFEINGGNVRKEKKRIISIDSIAYCKDNNDQFIYLKENNEDFYYNKNKLITHIKKSLDYYTSTKNNVLSNFYYNNIGQLSSEVYFHNSNNNELYLTNYLYDGNHKIIEEYFQFDKKRIFYLDENDNISRVEEYKNNHMSNYFNIIYKYRDNIQIYNKMHPDLFVRKYEECLKHLKNKIEKNGNTFYYQIGKIKKIEEKRDKLEKNYYFDNNLLYAYKESSGDKNIFYLIVKDTIRYIKNENVKVDTTEVSLNLLVKSINRNAQALKEKSKEFEYSLFFLNKEISINNQKIVVNKNDLAECDSIYTNSTRYNVKKIIFSGVYRRIDFEQRLNSNKLDAELKGILSEREKNIYCEVYIENLEGKTEIVTISIR